MTGTSAGAHKIIIDSAKKLVKNLLFFTIYSIYPLELPLRSLPLKTHIIYVSDDINILQFLWKLNKFFYYPLCFQRCFTWYLPHRNFSSWTNFFFLNNKYHYITRDLTVRKIFWPRRIISHFFSLTHFGLLVMSYHTDPCRSARTHEDQGYWWAWACCDVNGRPYGTTCTYYIPWELYNCKRRCSSWKWIVISERLKIHVYTMR